MGDAPTIADELNGTIMDHLATRRRRVTPKKQTVVQFLNRDDSKATTSRKQTDSNIHGDARFLPTPCSQLSYQHRKSCRLEVDQASVKPQNYIFAVGKVSHG